jgi:hypothetical protein
MNANNIKFRCSSLGALMTEARSKSGQLSETCKSELIKVFINEKYGRSKNIQNKYLEKGISQEEESITLYSKFKKNYFVNNKARMSNDFITGEWDILKNDIVTDIKTSWDIFSFFKSKNDSLNKDYYYQLHGYMSLTGAKSATLVYCLVNTPLNLIEQEKKSIWYKMDCPDNDSPEYVAACEEIELRSIYEDIPVNERVFEIEIERNEEIIEAINKRVLECREWMNLNLFEDEQKGI